MIVLVFILNLIYIHDVLNLSYIEINSIKSPFQISFHQDDHTTTHEYRRDISERTRNLSISSVKSHYTTATVYKHWKDAWLKKGRTIADT